MGKRYAFLADDQLEKRLDAIEAAMKQARELRGMAVNTSDVIKAALDAGLPVLAARYGGSVEALNELSRQLMIEARIAEAKRQAEGDD